MPKSVCFIFTLFLVHTALAQPPKQFSFTHYSTETGLISNQVNSVVQDKTGYIWIGTNEGLVRYDGTRYKSFRHIQNDSLTIPSNQIVQLLIDRSHNLWILNANGKAGIFDTKRFTYRNVPVRLRSNLSLRTPVKKLIADEYENIFLLLRGHELLTWDSKKNEFSADKNFIGIPREWKLNDLIHQPGTHKYWLGVQGLGLAVFNNASRKTSTPTQNVENEAALTQIKDAGNVANFMFDKKGRLWFSSWDTNYSYIYAYDFPKQNLLVNRKDFIKDFNSFYEVDGFLEQMNGFVWFKGDKAFGYYDERKNSFHLIPSGYVNERSIDYRIITSLFEDREQNIWVGTGNNGMFCFSPSREYFTNIKHRDRFTGAEGYGSPLSFITEKDGTILVSMWQDGLYRYDRNFNNVPLNIRGINEKNKVAAFEMAYSRDSSRIWIATFRGIYNYDTRSGIATYYNPAIFENKAVRQIAEDKMGNVWLGFSVNGVLKWDAVKGKRKFEDGFSKINGIPAVQVYDITIDSKGYVWVATAIYGVYVLDPVSDRVVMHFHNNALNELKLPDEGGRVVCEYSDSIMVIGTTRHILLYNRFTKKTTPITDGETITGDISSIEKDNQGHLWVSTTTSLYRVNIRTKVFISFNRNDGIPNDYFIVSASTVLPNGKMLFGSSGTMVYFDPAEVKVNTSFPDIIITDFRVMNKSLPVDSLMQLENIQLDYGTNSLTIDFATLTYSSSYVILYKLMGIDQEMRVADRTNQAVYSYLKPGDYTLIFHTVDAEGNLRENVMKLFININPPFYQSWWFYSIVAMIVVAALYWLDKVRIQNIRNEQQMRIALASNLHSDVNTTLRNINVLSEIASMKSLTQPEQAREYLKEIQTKSRNMVVAMNDVLWSISPENDSMPKTLERIAEITESITGRNNTSVDMEVGEMVASLRLDMKTRLEFISIYKLILQIVIEEMKCCRPLIQLDYIKPVLQLRIFAQKMELPAGNRTVARHIDEIRARAGAMNATLDIESDPKGTGFLLEVKI